MRLLVLVFKVKAGGMRVAQHKPPKADGAATATPEPAEGEAEEQQQVVEPPKAGAIFISGVEAKVSKRLSRFLRRCKVFIFNMGFCHY